MHIPLTEPIAPRYIHINPVTNRVHLLVPVVGGQEISTGNTRWATTALREFFDGGAMCELTAYKEALAFDIELFEPGHPQRMDKEVRLAQIEKYIEAVYVMGYNYGWAIEAVLGRPSNLYSIQLRPRAQDNYSRVVNPIFSVNRTIDESGAPASALYNAMHRIFPTTSITTADPRTRLTTVVLSALSDSASFVDIQQALGEQSLMLLGIAIDFTRCTDGTPATKEIIDALMHFEADATQADYIEALLGACALNIWETLPTPPFYSIPATASVNGRTERLSILTQFFLANLNVYCKAKRISMQNFGIIFDALPDLSNDLVHLISMALISGEDIERTICNFCNVNTDKFDLSRAINAEDLIVIRQKFERTYRTVTATNENPHMDDFMILDRDATGETAKFVTHQGAICINFAEIVDPTAASVDSEYFASIRADFAVHPAEVPHRNESIAGEVDADMDTLTRLKDEQWEHLPQAFKEACRAHPGVLSQHFLHAVAKGKQDGAKALLTAESANTQTLLRTPGIFTDYSHRTFNCTAYEYAYWAKDTHMCRMLEQHMDDETRAAMAAHIDEMERIDVVTGQPVGLVYNRIIDEERSAHFDFAPLKEAYQRFIDSCNAWHATGNWNAMRSAWIHLVGEQHDVPAHVAQEFCRPDRSFDPRPEFNEATLPRVLTYYNWTTGRYQDWFPVTTKDDFSFALMRVDCEEARGGKRWGWGGDGWLVDFVAITHLDEVRTSELTQSREHLNPPALSQNMSI